MMLYDNLLTIENPADLPEDKTYNDYLNPDSLVKIEHAKIEPALAEAAEGDRFQFERVGYFVCDGSGRFNRTVTLKDSYKPQT